MGDPAGDKQSACLNCGAVLTGQYCVKCGQKAQVHRTLRAFFHDLATGMLNFEGKVWRTLPLLAWKPGQLTRDYIEGKRARYVSPVALFLFTVFVMFESTGTIATPDISRVRADTNVSTRLSDDVPGWLREPIERAGTNPELTIYKLKASASKWSWAVIPLSVPFLWLMFPFSRRFRLYDHVVFATYSLCFMMLLLSAAMLVATAGFSAVAGFAMLVPPVHIYRQLRGAYSLGRWGALWRTAGLLAAAVMVLMLYFVTVLGAGLFE